MNETNLLDNCDFNSIETLWVKLHHFPKDQGTKQIPKICGQPAFRLKKFHSLKCYM